MKHIKHFLVLLTFLTLVFTASQAKAEAFAHFECEKGTVDVLGCQTVHTDSGDMVCVFMSFTNASSESVAPWSILSYNAFQDGIQLETSYLSSNMRPAGYEADDTQVRPGGTLPFYESYTLRNTSSPIEVEVSEMFSWDGNVVDCKMELGQAPGSSQEAAQPASAAASPAPAASLGISEDVLAQLLERISSLEARVSQLESQLVSTSEAYSEEIMVIE